MNAWLLTLPIISALTGAGLFKIVLGRLRKRVPGLAMRSLPGLLSQIESRMTDARQIHQVLPLAEGHIDHFLRNKLTTAMPMVAMFIGDKTINQFKGIFMEELEQLLPVFIKAYLEQALKPENIEPLVNDALGKSAKRLSAKAIWLGAGLGLAIGLVQLLFLYIILTLWH